MENHEATKNTPVQLAVLLAASLLIASLSIVGQGTQLVEFYETGCLNCARLEEFLGSIAPQYPELEIVRYEIHDPRGQELLNKLLTAYRAEVGPVPIVFIGNIAKVGDTFYGLEETPVVISGRAAELALEKVIRRAIAEDAPSPLTKLPMVATEAVFVTQADCSQCERLELVLAGVIERHPELGVRQLNADQETDAQLFARLLRLYGVKGRPPALFVGESALVGGVLYQRRQSPHTFAFTPTDNAILEETITRAIAEKAAPPLERLRLREQLTLWAVLGAAALDSVNPCDFAVLVLLLGTLLVIGKRTKVVWAGLAFSAGIFVAYFTMGFLIYSVLGLTVGTRAFRDPFILAVSALAILVGLWEMKDLLWYSRWFSIEVPERWKPAVKRFTSSAVTIPGAFVIGLLDSLFLAPCTSGPYLVILTLLSQTATRWRGAGYLLLYNLIFVLPMIGVTLAVHLGFTTTARAERWRKARLGKLHFATGMVMLLLGVGMIVGLHLGYL